MLSIKKMFIGILTNLYTIGTMVGALDTAVTTNTNNISTLTNTVDNLDSYTKSSVTVVSTYANTSGQTFAIEKAGKIATIKITTVKAIPARQDVQIATLPTGYRPGVQVLKFIYTPTASGSDNAVRIMINTNGVVNAYWYGTSGSTSGSLNIQEYIPYICA